MQYAVQLSFISWFCENESDKDAALCQGVSLELPRKHTTCLLGHVITTHVLANISSQQIFEFDKFTEFQKSAKIF